MLFGFFKSLTCNLIIVGFSCKFSFIRGRGRELGTPAEVSLYKGGSGISFIFKECSILPWRQVPIL